MKKLLILSALGLFALATTQVEARRRIVETTTEDAVIETNSVESDIIGHSGKPCRYTEGPTYKCPDCPVCPKVHCQTELVSDCPGCVKGPRACSNGRCHR